MSMLIKNCNIVTMRDKNEIIQNGAIYIEGGRIVDFGDKTAIEEKYHSKNFTKIINASKKTVFPGFINIHAHSVLSILRGQAEDEPTYTSVYHKMFPITEIMNEEDVFCMAKLAYVEMLKYGTTTVVDHFGSSGEDLAKAATKIGIRAYLNDTVLDMDQEKMKEKRYEQREKLGEKTLNSSVEFIKKWDKTNNGRIRAIMVPHATDTCSPELLKAIASVAREYNLGITLHLAQNTTEVEQIRRKYNKTVSQYLEDVGILGPLFIGAHGIFLGEEDFVTLGNHNANLAHCPVIIAKRGYTAPLRELMQEGVNICLGTDNMAEDIVQAMKVAQMAYRIRNMIAETPKAEDVIQMGTINGAKALGRESDLGMIEKGRIADLVIVDYNKPNYIPLFKNNIVSNFVHTGLASDIDTVIVDGEILVEGGRYVKEDEQQIMEAAQIASDRVWRKWRKNR